jgi:hypothetical protein
MDVWTQVYALFLIVLTLFAHPTNGLRFFLAPGQTKCLKEEIHKNIVVSGEYEFSDAPGQTASVLVSFRGNLFYDAKMFSFCRSKTRVGTR